jgi:hypothetical protein
MFRVNLRPPFTVVGVMTGGFAMLPSSAMLCRSNYVAAALLRLHRAVVRILALLLATMPMIAHAADEDLPGRVGRVAEFAGELYLSPESGTGDWTSIGRNYPITSGDNLWVSTNGRAEVDYGGGQFRFAGETNLHVSRLDDRQLALFVAQGQLIVRVRVLDPGDSASVDTPNAQVQLTRAGLYRIDVTDPQQTSVVVREGEALVALASGTQQVLPGQTATVSGSGEVTADLRNGIGGDGFDTWSVSRDRRYERNSAGSYVSREMVGAVELDDYGTWQNDPDYGAVWYPSQVAADWTPYRDGYWIQSGGWGLTWVDFAPWGYAPFHYGRWAHVGGRWGWCPGGYVARPYWAPALVAWYGGPGWSYSISAGTPVYGWVPLGWGERYVPWWGRRECGERCWTHYNRPYAVNRAERRDAPPTRYANAGVPGAITAVAGATLVGGKPVAANLIRLAPQAASSAPVLALAPAIKPLRIPAAPGAAGVPAPASTFYPTSRPALTGGGTASRPMLPSTAAPMTSSVPMIAPGSARSMLPPTTVAPSLAPGSAAAVLAPAPAVNVVRPLPVDRNARGNAPVAATPENPPNSIPVPARAPVMQQVPPPNAGPPLSPAAQQAYRPPVQPMYVAPAQPMYRPASPAPLPVAPSVAPAAAPMPQPGGQGNAHAGAASNGGAQVAPAKPVVVVPPVGAATVAK